MNGKIKELFSKLKNGKLIFILGICGILLIFISSFSSEKSTEETVSESGFDTVAYREELEQNVKELVQGITGSQQVSVMITLDTGITYNYADETRFNKSNRESSDTTDVSTDSEKKYIIVTDADGNEKPLIINEQLPLVRGVAVVYSSVGAQDFNEKIEEALMATLSVTYKRIYISNTGGN